MMDTESCKHELRVMRDGDVPRQRFCRTARLARGIVRPEQGGAGQGAELMGFLHFRDGTQWPLQLSESAYTSGAFTLQDNGPQQALPRRMLHCLGIHRVRPDRKAHDLSRLREEGNLVLTLETDPDQQWRVSIGGDVQEWPDCLQFRITSY